MSNYTVIDLKNEGNEPKIVSAGKPEKAAELVLGVRLVRSGAKQDLRARVYFQNEGQPVSMVRLYTKVDER